MRGAIPRILSRVGNVRYGPSRERGILIGYLGEWAAYRWAHNLEANQIVDWIEHIARNFRRRDDGGDIRIRVNGSNRKRVIEVKSRPISRPPFEDDTFDIAWKRIPSVNRELLLFVCVHSGLSCAWLAGWLTRDEWLDRSRPIFPGEPLPHSGRRAEVPNISIELRALRPIEELECSNT